MINRPVATQKHNCSRKRAAGSLRCQDGDMIGATITPYAAYNLNYERFAFTTFGAADRAAA
jgi:hypothetical protein